MHTRIRGKKGPKDNGRSNQSDTNNTRRHYPTPENNGYGPHYTAGPVHTLTDPIQTQLIVGPVNDPYEQEADMVAERVTARQQAPPISRLGKGSLAQRQVSEEDAPLQRQVVGEEEPIQRQAVEDEEPVQRQAAEEEELIQRQVVEDEAPVQRQAMDEEESIQRQAVEAEEPIRRQMVEEVQRQPEKEKRSLVQAHQRTGNNGAVSSSRMSDTSYAISNKSAGEPLNPSTRSTLESHMGRDLSDVRIHHDGAAQNAARALRARAFTHQNHIWLGAGESQNDDHLIAHEVTHVLQQTGGVQRQPLVQRVETPPMVAEPTPASEAIEESTEEPIPASRENTLQETSLSFAHTAEQTLGLEEGYIETLDESDLGLPPKGEAQERAKSALSEIGTATEQLQAKTLAVSEEGQKGPEQEPKPAEKPQDTITPEEEPEAVIAEVEAAQAPVEEMSVPTDQISGPGPESDMAMGRLQGAQDIDPSLIAFGEAINEQIAGLRERAANNLSRTSMQLQGEATTQRAVIRSSMGASQVAVSGIMDNTRTRVTESKTAAQETLTQQGENAHTRNVEITGAETTRLQENINGSVEEARTIFSDADEEVRSTGESEGQHGHDYAYNLARQARELGRSEAAYYRRTEEDEDLGEDKADAVIDVANRFARQLERDGRNLHSDVREQADEAREQITAEEEPTVSGLEEVGPGAVEGIQTFLGSVDEAVDGVIQQGSDQLDSAEAGALGEIDNLDRATQGRGAALLAEGEANLDAALTAGTLAQTNLAGQAGQMLDEAGRDSIDQLVEVSTLGAAYENPGEPVLVQRQSDDNLDAGVPLPAGVPQGDQEEVFGQLNQAGPALDQAADSQTAELSQSLGDTAASANQAGSTWVDETQGNMDSLANVADTGLTETADGASGQLGATLEQGETQAITEVDRISQDVANNVEEVRQSVNAGVSEAAGSLRGGVEEGNAHADETFGELPEEMNEAAEAQESFWGRVGHWVSEQLADTWEAIKGMADWGFILDLVVGIVVGVLVAVAVAALIGTGIGAVLVAGVLAGAAGFAAAQMSANVRHGDPLFQGVGHAAILGAFVGLGGAIASVASLGLLAGTGVVMLAAGAGTVVANVSTGRNWDDHLLATVFIVGVFHAVMKPVMDRVPIRIRGRRGSAPERTPSESEPTASRLSIRARLAEYYRRLRSEPRARTAEEGLEKVRRVLIEVEDDLSGILRKDPPPPPNRSDGRMYPPLDDMVTRHPDGRITARTRGHNIEIEPDGAIKITNRRSGAVEFEQPGAERVSPPTVVPPIDRDEE